MTTSIFTVGGTVQAGGGVYIARRADEELLKLCRSSTFAYILSPRQIGKSSLMVRTAERLAEAGIQSVMIDLTQLGVNVSAEAWYLGLLAAIEDQLLLNEDVVAWWRAREHLGMAQRLTQFFQEVLLKEVAGPVVVFVDEIDTTLSLNFTDDFYAAIRYLYNARATAPELARLSFVLIGVATPGDLIRDAKRTPFNIGQRVDLQDWTFEEALPLADGLGLAPDVARQVLQWALRWTGGHPYLTQRLCEAIRAANHADWTQPQLNDLVAQTFLGDRSEKDNNLQFVRDMLTKRAPDQAAVLTVYRDILRGRRVPDEEQSIVKAHLKLSGVAVRERERLRVRNPLYRRVFDDRWIGEHLPPTYWTVRVRRAARLIVGLSVLSVVLLGLAIYAVGRAGEAVRQQARADSALAQAQTAVAEQQTAVADQQAALVRESAAKADADARRQEAEAERAFAEAQALGFASQAQPDAELRLLLAIEAAKPVIERRATDKNEQIAGMLFQAVASSHLQAVLRGHTAPLTAVAFSPDGARVASASWDGSARLWDTGTGALVAELKGHAAAVAGVAWSPNGRLVATTSGDGTGRIWDAGTGALLAELKGHAGPVDHVAWSPDSALLATGGADGTARVWGADGTPVAVLGGGAGPIVGLAWSADGARVVAAGAGGSATIWDAASGAALVELKRDASPETPDAPPPPGKLALTGASFSPDGQQVMTTYEDGATLLWDANGGPPVHELDGRVGALLAAAYAPVPRVVSAGNIFEPSPPDQATYIATGSDDGVLRLWRSDTGVLVAEVKIGTLPIWGVAWSPDSQQIASVGGDGSVRLWRLDITPAENGEPQKEALSAAGVFRGHTGHVVSVAWSRDGERIVSAGVDGTARVWNVGGGNLGTSVPANVENGILDRITFSPDGGRLLVVAGDILVRDMVGNAIATIPAADQTVINADFTPDGKRILTILATQDNPDERVAQLWDAASGQALAASSLGAAGADAPLFAVDGRFLVTNDRATITIWDMTDDQAAARIPRNGDQLPYTAAVSADRTLFALAFSSGTVRIWNGPAAAEQVFRQASSIGAMRFSPDGSRLFAVANGIPTSWDTASGAPLATFSSQDGSIVAMAFDPAGRLLTASDGGVARVWDARTGVPLATVMDDKRFSRVAAWSPDGRRLLVARANALQLYTTNFADLFAQLRSRSLRALTAAERQRFGLAPVAGAPSGTAAISPTTDFVDFPTQGAPPAILKRLSTDEWRDYAGRYVFDRVAPTRVILRHTVLPSVQQWQEQGGEASLRGIQFAFKSRGWDAGPHIFPGPDGIWLFTPMSQVGVHSASGNSGTIDGVFWYSIGVEMVGNYDNELPSGPVWENTKAVLGALSLRLGTPPRQLISLGREYSSGRTTPGRSVTKEWVWSEVERWIAENGPRP